MLLCAWRWPRVGRSLYFLLFASAAVLNTMTVQHTPSVYLDYAQFAFLPWYKAFINGFFASHTQAIVQTIAIGQGMIAVSMCLKGSWFRLGALGAIGFLTGIAPLGVGAGFPSTLVMATGTFVLYRQPLQGYLWASDRKFKRAVTH
jgi:hypothetical protein